MPDRNRVVRDLAEDNLASRNDRHSRTNVRSVSRGMARAMGERTSRFSRRGWEEETRVTRESRRRRGRGERGRKLSELTTARRVAMKPSTYARVVTRL